MHVRNACRRWTIREVQFTDIWQNISRYWRWAHLTHLEYWQSIILYPLPAVYLYALASWFELRFGLYLLVCAVDGRIQGKANYRVNPCSYVSVLFFSQCGFTTLFRFCREIKVALYTKPDMLLWCHHRESWLSVKCFLYKGKGKGAYTWYSASS